MKLVLKEKVFTLKERFNVTDEQEQPLYSVEGKFFSWGHQLDIEDASGAHMAHIKQKVFALLPRYFITCDGMEEMELKVTSTSSTRTTRWKPRTATGKCAATFCIMNTPSKRARRPSPPSPRSG